METRNTSARTKRSLTPRRFLVASKAMKLKWIFSLSLVVAVLALSGCTSTLNDSKRMTWNPIAKDTVEGRYDRTPAEIWAATKDVLKHQGIIVRDDTVKNVVEASVDERVVWVKVEEFDTKTTRVLVQSQTKGGVADLEMASYIKEQIAIRLATGNFTPATPVKR
jgi:hypothetical protein